MSATEYAELWDAPDAKREREPGFWDVYCAGCGRYVVLAYSPVEPYSERCRACRAQEAAATFAAHGLQWLERERQRGR